MKKLRTSLLALTVIASLASCSDDDKPTIVNEEEVITTVTATLTPENGSTPIVLTSRDLDGDGPDAPIVTASAPFAAGVTYNGTVTFLNELASPAENITAEIFEESDEHQLFFQQTGGPLGTFTYADADVNAHPIGLSFVYKAAESAATGTLTITLIHEPNKSGTNVPAGDITNAGGSTDAEVTFPVTIQ